MTAAVTPFDTRPLVTLDESSHIYTHRDGHRPPSVTNILGQVKPLSPLAPKIPIWIRRALSRGLSTNPEKSV